MSHIEGFEVPNSHLFLEETFQNFAFVENTPMLIEEEVYNINQVKDVGSNNWARNVSVP